MQIRSARQNETTANNNNDCHCFFSSPIAIRHWPCWEPSGHREQYWFIRRSRRPLNSQSTKAKKKKKLRSSRKKSVVVRCNSNFHVACVRGHRSTYHTVGWLAWHWPAVSESSRWDAVITVIFLRTRASSVTVAHTHTHFSPLDLRLQFLHCRRESHKPKSARACTAHLLLLMLFGHRASALLALGHCSGESPSIAIDMLASTHTAATYAWTETLLENRAIAQYNCGNCSHSVECNNS